MKCEMSDKILRKNLINNESRNLKINITKVLKRNVQSRRCKLRKKRLKIDCNVSKDINTEQELNKIQIDIEDENTNTANADNNFIDNTSPTETPTETCPTYDHNYFTNNDVDNYSIKEEKDTEFKKECSEENLLTVETSTESKENDKELNIKKENNTKVYECKKCSKKFTSFKELIEHRRVVQHSKTIKKICKICNKSISYKSMKKHLRTHTKEKPFSCEVCGMSFSVRGNLQRHWYARHSAIKPHHCTLCEKGFTSPGLLRNHMRTHSGEKPFVCNVCHKSFTTSSLLKNHVNIHNDKGPFICNYCGKSFNQLNYFQKHLNNHDNSSKYYFSKSKYSFIAHPTVHCHSNNYFTYFYATRIN